MSSAIQNSIPQEPGRWQAIALAVAVHAALLTFLWVGIRWQSDTPQTVEAEVWSPQEIEAAPPPPPPIPVEAPEPVKEAPPEVKETPVEKPDIALEQEKKKQEEKKARDDEAKQEAKLEKQKADKEKKLADEKKRQQDALDAKKLAKLRQEDLKRIAAETNKIDATGTAVRAQGSSKDVAWAGRVKAKIKSNTHFLGSSDTNDPVEFDLKLFPDGSVASARKTKSSGIPEFDDAVRRAIDLSQPFPADSSGRVPPNVTISHRPKDQ